MHATRPESIAPLRHAEGHLRRVITMLEAGAPCLDVAALAQAVEGAIANARRAIIHDHMEHCLTGGAADPAELRALAKLL